MRVELTILDPRLRELVDPDAQLSLVADGFSFTEGPLWREDSLVFSDIPNDCMWEWSASGGCRTYRQPSAKANGNTLDHEGRLLTCEHATCRVVRESSDGKLETVASHFNGRELNSPNDVVTTRDGSIWFTDPPIGRTQLFGIERDQELDFSGVFRSRPEGNMELVTDRFAGPNGLCFTADERTLFVNDTPTRAIWKFPVREDFSIGGGRLWAVTPGDAPGAPDGMKIDWHGNLWVSGPGGIHVFDQGAVRLGVIQIDRVVGNFDWGGEGFRTLFICASDRVYQLPTRVGTSRVARSAV